MRCTNFLDPNFKAEMVSFHNSRMYPPKYRKETSMVKLSMEHVNAICHAEFFTDAAISKLDGSRMRKTVECDLLRLAELKMFIIAGMTDSEKLFIERPKTDGYKDTLAGPD